MENKVVECIQVLNEVKKCVEWVNKCKSIYFMVISYELCILMNGVFGVIELL